MPRFQAEDRNITIVRELGPRRVCAAHPRSCGAAEVDITPPFGYAMAGYSYAGLVGRGLRQRLCARILLLEDAREQRAAICILDLWSASRYLHECVCAFLGPELQLKPAEIVLVGTHTHTAPGNCSGNTLYDAFAQPRPGFDEPLANWLARRIADGIKIAADNAVSARIGFAEGRVWNGLAHNRSLAAFQANPEHLLWNEPGWPGEGGGGLREDLRSIDARVRVLAATTTGGKLIASLATFACHATALGAQWDLYSPDWPGVASRVARLRLGGSAAGQPVVAVTAGPGGDVNACVAGSEGGMERAVRVGTAIGEKIADLAEQAAAGARDFDLVAVRRTPRAAGANVPGVDGAALASTWMLGVPTIGGSEDGQSLFEPISREGTRDLNGDPNDPQFPKCEALGFLQRLVNTTKLLAPSPLLPLQTVQIGGTLIAFVPGEPTAMTGFHLERALLTPAVERVLVIGQAGDYNGYFATREEYAVQHYEGSSTIYGRNSEPYLVAAFAHLPSLPEPSDEAAVFTVASAAMLFEALGPERIPGVRRAEQGMENGRAVVRWSMPEGASPIAAEGPLVIFESLRDGAWLPYSNGVTAWNDVDQDIEVRRSYSLEAVLGGEASWSINFPPPEDWNEASRWRIRARWGTHEFDTITLR